MATCGHSRDTLVYALLVPAVAGLQTEKERKRAGNILFAKAPQSCAAKIPATKYNSTADSVTLSEKSASSYE
jgi:hypothetical protein